MTPQMVIKVDMGYKGLDLWWSNLLHRTKICVQSGY